MAEFDAMLSKAYEIELLVLEKTHGTARVLLPMRALKYAVPAETYVVFPFESIVATDGVAAVYIGVFPLSCTNTEQPVSTLPVEK